MLCWPSDISGWDVANSANFQYMFHQATAFTGTGIGSWDVTSAVTDMNHMFHQATAFTGTGIGGWDVSEVTDFSSM